MDNKTYKRGLRRELPIYEDSMSNIAYLQTGDVIPVEIMEKLNKIGCTSFVLTEEQMKDVLKRIERENQND